MKQEHGCEVIVNGIMPSLKYYLRLLSNPSDFLQGYEAALQTDYEASTDVKAVHIERWNRLRSQEELIKFLVFEASTLERSRIKPRRRLNNTRPAL